MLQVDRKKRITIKSLLDHPWLKKGVYSPVKTNTKDPKRREEPCVSLMAEYYGLTNDAMWKHLNKWKYDYSTATYLLLLERDQRNQSLKMYIGINKALLKNQVNISVLVEKLRD